MSVEEIKQLKVGERVVWDDIKGVINRILPQSEVTCILTDLGDNLWIDQNVAAPTLHYE